MIYKGNMNRMNMKLYLHKIESNSLQPGYRYCFSNNNVR